MTSEQKGQCIFACGATIDGVADPTAKCHFHDERGRFMLTVYDSHIYVMRPREENLEHANCMACPCSDEAGRVVEHGFPPGLDTNEQIAVWIDEHPGMNKPWRWWVSCHGTWKEYTTN